MLDCELSLKFPIAKLLDYESRWNELESSDNPFAISEQERKTPKQHSKSSKNQTIKIDRKQILEYPQDKLPADAEFKGYEEVIVQDIILTTDNVFMARLKNLGFNRPIYRYNSLKVTTII